MLVLAILVARRFGNPGAEESREEPSSWTVNPLKDLERWCMDRVQSNEEQ